jgi:hypothetical protein
LQTSSLALKSQSAIELLLTQPALLDNLRKAHTGSYGIVLSLLGCLDHGVRAKKLVDRVIDACDHVTHLREEILSLRVQYSLTTSIADIDDVRREEILDKAVRALERYFFLIAFASYVEEQGDWKQTFSDWLKVMVLVTLVFLVVPLLSYMNHSGENRNMEVCLRTLLYH